ncbi:MAG: hypothetical protein JNJ54_19555 [Myxococcaceae bacterium]|nr:hypothetical protein [Myxococcaceae bacterium]
MRSPLFAAALLFAVTASAETFRGLDVVNVSLARQVMTAEANADLRVSDRMVIAVHGIRLERTSQSYFGSAPLALDEPYMVRDAAGAEYRMWVRTVANRLIVVEIQPRQLAESKDPLVGRFRATSITIGGNEARPTFGDLRLMPDGRYFMGGARGHWQWADGQLVLDGPVSYWGSGAVSADVRSITFTFTRGPVEWKVTYERVGEGGVDPVALR